MRALSDLPRRKQLRVLRDLVLPRQRKRLQCYRGVLAVGIGVRRTAGKSIGRVNCIKIAVKKKLGSPREPLPESVRVSVPDVGLVQVPVDVEQVSGFEPQGWIADGLELGRGNEGTVGLLAHRGTSRLWVATARHVLVHFGDGQVEWESAFGDVGRGTVTPGLDDVTHDGERVDAGLIDVLEAGPASEPGMAPWGSRTAPYHHLANHHEAVVCGRHGQVECDFHLEWESGAAPPEFSNSYRCVSYVQDHGSETMSGDSGAPVLTRANGGVLLGIHLGRYFDERGASIGVALCASDVLRILGQEIGVPDMRLKSLGS